MARYLRERGVVVLEVKGWTGSSRSSFSKALSRIDISQVSDQELDKKLADMSQLYSLDLALVSEERRFEVRFRNTKEVSISLWDFSVVFWREGARLTSLTPYDTLTGMRLDMLNVLGQEAGLRVLGVSVSRSAEKLRQVWTAGNVEMTVTVAGEGQRSRELPRWLYPDIEA